MGIDTGVRPAYRGLTMPELKNISVKHDQIITWMIANPGVPLSICAAQFGITQSWLSSLIHSDLFQAKIRERQDDAFDEVKISVRDRITALAHESLKRLTDRVMVETDVDKISNASEVALKALGFGAPKVNGNGQSTITINNVVDKDVLAQARQRMEGRTIEGQAQHVVPATISKAQEIAE